VKAGNRAEIAYELEGAKALIEDYMEDGL